MSDLPAIKLKLFSFGVLVLRNLIALISAEGFDIKSHDLPMQRVYFHTCNNWEHENLNISLRE